MKRAILSACSAVALICAFPAAALAGGDREGHLMVSPNQIEWRDAGSLPPGAEIAVLEGDPSQAEEFTMRLRFPADYDIPVHTHPAVERVTVLEGTFYFAAGKEFDREEARELGPGSLAVMDVGVPMYGFTRNEPVVIQLNGIGPWGIDYLDPKDDPRQTDR